MFVSINYLTVQSEDGADVGARFDEVKQHLLAAPGFSRFRLLQPHEENNDWLVYTEWDDLAAYDAWKASSLYGRMHPHRGAHPGAHPGGHPGAHPGGHPGGPPAMPSASKVLYYDVATELSAAHPDTRGA